MIRKILTSKKGSSSILVILLMVVLVVFGIAALTTALSNMRLGQKVAERTNTYYAAEGLASERFAMIDKAATDANGAESALIDSVSALGFETDITAGANTIVITYDTWQEDVGVRTTLTMTDDDPGSLCITGWVQINKDE